VLIGQVSAVKLTSPGPTSPVDVQSLVQSVVSMTNGGVDADHSSEAVLSQSAVEPRFDRQLTNCRLIEGTDVILSCHVTGNPMPNVSLCLVYCGHIIIAKITN